MDLFFSPLIPNGYIFPSFCLLIIFFEIIFIKRFRMTLLILFFQLISESIFDNNIGFKTMLLSFLIMLILSLQEKLKAWHFGSVLGIFLIPSVLYGVSFLAYEWQSVGFFASFSSQLIHFLSTLLIFPLFFFIYDKFLDDKKIGMI